MIVAVNPRAKNKQNKVTNDLKVKPTGGNDMRKLLVALMMVAFAATAFAADVKFSGSYEVDGKYQRNYGLADSDVATNSYYEHDFDLWMNVQTDKDTFFKTKLELLDSTIGATHDGNNKVVYPGSDSGYAGTTQFSVQRAWLGHNFGGVLVEAGLMNSGSWGYAFADDAEGSYRVKATFDVAGGKLTVLTQKKDERGSDATKDAENDDADKYSIGYKGTFGGIMIAPKLDYDINGNGTINQETNEGADTKVIDFNLAAGGKFGAVTVETEFKYNTTSYADEAAGRKDFDLYGIYANVNYNYGAGVVGFLTAYGSTDKDMNKGFDFDDDFDSTFILGDDMGLGGGDDLTGFWANALYATYDVNDKLSLMGKLAYVTSNWDAGAYEDASAWELDASATYAITKELTYYVNFGYAKVDLDASDPDPIVLVKHGLVLNF